MEEVMLRDPGSGHEGHSRLTSSAVFQHQRPLSGILLLPNPPSFPPLRAPPVFSHVCFNSRYVTHAVEKLWARRILISGLKGDQSWTGICCLIDNLQLFSFRFPFLSITYSTYAFFSLSFSCSFTCKITARCLFWRECKVLSSLSDFLKIHKIFISYYLIKMTFFSNWPDPSNSQKHVDKHTPTHYHFQK